MPCKHRLVKRERRLRGPLIVAAVSLLLYSLLPLGTALEFGGDEGLELMKAFLCGKGFVLYQQIWSDQPPLFTMLLSWGFQTCGASLLVARLIAAVFGVILFAAFYWLVRRLSGDWVAALATFLLAASPAVFMLSVSVMQEVPAIGVALFAACLLSRWREQRRWAWLLGSGALMGVALGIKLTALIVAPAMFAELLLANRDRGDKAWDRRSVLQMVAWGLATALVFAFISLIWGRGSFQSSFQAHTSLHPAPGAGRPEDHVLPLKLFWDHAECVGAALVGLCLIARCRCWREWTFPVVLLLTVLGIHAVHRPWWMYYYVHLAVPLSWLAAYAACEVFRVIARLLAESRYRVASAKTWQAVALCTLLGVLLVRSEGRLEAGIGDMRHRARADVNPIVKQMRASASRTHWVYSHRAVFPFCAGLPMPPELAVVSLKRYWSGQISDREVVEICRRYRVEQLVLEKPQIRQEWKNYLEDFKVAYENEGFCLYVLNATRP